MAVFGQSPVTRFAVPEEVFDNVEWMLDKRSHRGLRCARFLNQAIAVDSEH